MSRYNQYIEYTSNFKPVTLYVAAVINIDGPTEVAVESNLTITCSSQAIHQDLIYFVRNGMVLTSNANVTVSFLGLGYSVLTVYRVEQEDAGVYSCIMNSGRDGGTASAELNITVREGK